MILNTLHDLFTRTPADILYAAFVLPLSLALIGLTWGRVDSPILDRLRVVGGYALAAWVLVVIAAASLAANGGRVEMLLPPLERAVTAGLVVLSVWALGLRPGRAGNSASLIALLVIFIAYILHSGEWAGQAAATTFNATGFALFWSILTLAIAAAGAGVVVVEAPTLRHVVLRLLVFASFGVGGITHLMLIAQGEAVGNDAGLTRLSVLVAFSLLLVLAYRTGIVLLREVRMRATVSPPPSTSVVPLPKLPQASGAGDRESAQLMRALGIMLEGATPQRIPERIADAAMMVVKTDIALILRLRSATHADVVWGQDRVMERVLPPMIMALDQQPTLVNAIERQTQRPLFPDRNVEELRELYGYYDIQGMGPAYCQPLTSGGRMPGVLIVALPYSRRELSDPERELLRGIAIIGAKLLHLSDTAEAELSAQPSSPRDESRLNALNAELDEARAQVSRLNEQVAALHEELERERGAIALTLIETDDEESQSISQQMQALVQQEQQMVQARDQLAARLRDAETALIGAVSTDNEMMYKQMIDVLNSEREDLIAERDRLQTQIATLRSGAPIPTVVHDLLDRMSREKAELEQDRRALAERLTGIEDQLHALGVDGGAAGLAQVMQSLYEQRAALQLNYEQVKAERDRLLQAHGDGERALYGEVDKQVKALQAQLAYLAADREAALKQRDRMRAERDELLARQHELEEDYARLNLENAVMRNGQAELQQALVTQAQETHDDAPQIVTIYREKRDSDDSAAIMGMVQELRTPLTSIIGYVDLLLSETAGILGEMQRRFLARVASNSSRLAHMLEDVARLAALDSGDPGILVERVNPVTLIEEAITHAAPQFREKNTILNLDLPDRPPMIRADKDAIGQAIGQLLTNAYLVSPYGSAITIAARTEEITPEGVPMFAISISDQGGGIAAADLPRVFARRYRADNPLIPGVGDTGVGLAIARALVEAHEGRIGVESVPGVGATFTIVLPIERAAQPEMVD